MKILVLNSGSSSLKFQLFTLPELSVAASGLVEAIGEEKGAARLVCNDSSGNEHEQRHIQPVADHTKALQIMVEMLRKSGQFAGTHELAAIGHRVVHGGEQFSRPVRIDPDVIAAIEQLSPLAPLHNPANLTGIRVAMEHAPEVPQVAVFDTAFHQSIPEHAFLYALPRRLYEEYHVRRYGFHGTSHGHVTARAAQYLGRPIEELNMISMHLGNGASVAAVQGGKCIDTSMGMTPLEGLIMGTRSGDFDPAVLFYLARETGMDIDELDALVNRQSGLKGICGRNDMRTITEAAEQGDTTARLALAMFCYRLKKYIGAYLAALGRVDCLVFTGGIGENSAVVRSMTCQGLEPLGMAVDAEKNRAKREDILAIHGRISNSAILVVPTNEELEIARQTMRALARGDNEFPS